MNFSRSWQPPSLDNLVDFNEGPNSSVVYTPLSPQHAWTIEVGTRESIRGLSGSCRFIARGFVMNCSRSMTPSGTILGQETCRASNHQGIEASLEVELLREILVPKQSNRAGDRLSFDQSYTLNDFHFDENAVYGDNRIREFRFTFTKRNCFTKARLVSMRVQICSVTSRVIQLTRRTRSLQTVMCCLFSVRDFDGPTDSQSLSIAGT
jgi:hypothetical protein